MSPPNICAILPLGLALVLSACAPEQDQRVPGPGPEPARRVVFGPGDFERAGGPLSLPIEAESYWRPTRAEVSRFEVVLDSTLRAARAEQSSIPPGGLAGYSVQYVGYVANGRRHMYANGSCGDEPDIETRWVFVLDGGACYFGASFDATAGRLTDVRFNGEA